MKYFYLIISLAFIIITGCEKKHSKFTLKHAADPNCGWINLNTVKPEVSDSTNSVSYLDSTFQFSLGYRQKLRLLSNTKFEELLFETDIKPLTDNAEFTFVISLENSGKQVFWEGAKFSTKNFPKGKWSRGTHKVKLPADKINDKTEVLVYVWNNNGSTEVDNINLEGM